MKIGGLEKFSLIDYPGKTCAIIFTQGCFLRCKFCHNPELVEPSLFQKPISEEEIFVFLKSRIGKLDAVTITGGEPTFHNDLLEFIAKVKAMGFLVKLDSTGYLPKVIKAAIDSKNVDYIAMDIKAPLDKYSIVTQVGANPVKISESISLIMNSGLDYEFRTTVVKKLTTKDDIFSIAELIKGAKRYYLQKFVSTKILDEDLEGAETYTDEEFEELKNTIQSNFGLCSIR